MGAADTISSIDEPVVPRPPLKGVDAPSPSPAAEKPGVVSYALLDKIKARDGNQAASETVEIPKPPVAAEAASATMPKAVVDAKDSAVLTSVSNLRASLKQPAAPAAVAPDAAPQMISSEAKSERAAAEQAEAQALLQKTEVATQAPAAKKEAFMSDEQATAVLKGMKERQAMAAEKATYGASPSLDAQLAKDQEQLAADKDRRDALLEKTARDAEALKLRTEKMASGLPKETPASTEQATRPAAKPETTSVASEKKAEKQLDISEQYAESKKALVGEVATLSQKIDALPYGSNESFTLRQQRAAVLEKLDTVDAKKDRIDSLQAQQTELRKKIGSAATASMTAKELKGLVGQLEKVDAAMELARDPEAIAKRERLIENFKQRKGTGSWKDWLTGKGITQGEEGILAREEQKLASMKRALGIGEQQPAQQRGRANIPTATPRQTFTGRTSPSYDSTPTPPSRYDRSTPVERLADPEAYARATVENMVGKLEDTLDDVALMIVEKRRQGARTEELTALYDAQEGLKKQIETLRGRGPEELARYGRELQAADATRDAILARAANKGPSILERCRQAGEFYKSLPWQAKLAAGLGLGALAVSGGGVGALVGVSGSLVQRFMGGMASFVTAEAYLNRPDATGTEKSAGRKKFNTALALTFGVLLGSGAASHMVSSAGHEIAAGVGSLARGAGELAKAGAHAVGEGLGVAGGVLAEGARAGARMAGEGLSTVASVGAEGLQHGAQYASENFAPAMQHAGEAITSAAHTAAEVAQPYIDSGSDWAVASADAAREHGGQFLAQAKLGGEYLMQDAKAAIPGAMASGEQFLANAKLGGEYMFADARDAIPGVVQGARAGAADLMATAGDAAIKAGVNLNAMSDGIRA